MRLRHLSLATAIIVVAPLAVFAQPPNGTPGRGRPASAAARALENRQAALRGRGVADGPRNPRLPGAIGRDRAAERRPDRVGPQFGTGRLGREFPSRREFGLGHRPDFATDRVREARADRDRPANGRSTMRSEPRPARNRFAFTRADRLLAQRLAQIDKMRDLAASNGNEQLLDRADELERIARRQHDRRTFEGEPRERNEALPLRPETTKPRD